MVFDIATCLYRAFYFDKMDKVLPNVLVTASSFLSFWGGISLEYDKV